MAVALDLEAVSALCAEVAFLSLTDSIALKTVFGGVGLSMHSNRRFPTAALEAGAAGYLLKDQAVEDLVEAIRTVMAGRVFLCQLAASTVAQAYVAGSAESRPSSSPTLTARERKVLQLVAEGYSGRQIARRLHLRPKTVSTHRQHIMDKLGIHNVAGLTKYAIEHGLTSVDTDELT